MAIFAKPALAIAFGALIFCAETCLHADTLVRVASAPFELPYYDWMAAGFLILAGVQSQRAWTDARREYQAVAWAFMLSLLVGAFLASLGDWATPPSESEWGISEGAFLVIIGGLCVVALCALVSTIRDPRR